MTEAQKALEELIAAYSIGQSSYDYTAKLAIVRTGLQRADKVDGLAKALQKSQKMVFLLHDNYGQDETRQIGNMIAEALAAFGEGV